ncbi:hypothetical protein DPMN_148561 [Dreissena polymorpha]|uniref:Uncharacterized protein n=1 Tax=Dreissena polymorpha TaxID=45954 RepID=A0A9D4FBZ1_DREPO|nr:hypothetical protein DPMN_148374 [Dreissena polymorpha]KAH3795016.1 hypothetical protein DPMN_148561 [Dreissena polymorpha]
MTTAAMARLRWLWTSSFMGFPNKYRLYKPLVVSYCTAARPGRFTQTQKAGYRLLKTNVSEGRKICSEHDCNTC